MTPAVKLNINRVKRVLRGLCGKQGPLGNGSERLNKGMYATTAARLMTNSDVRGRNHVWCVEDRNLDRVGVEDGNIMARGKSTGCPESGGPLSLPMPPCCECTGRVN